MNILTCLAASLLLAFSAAAHTQPATSKAGLANATLLIVRHAEKPSVGDGLTPQGEARARAYADYFRSFSIHDSPLRIDALVAAADSAKSRRPRLTLEPLSRALNLPIQQPFGDRDAQALTDWLRQGPPSRTILIAWRHSEIPNLLSALGVDPEALLPGGRWPEAVYDWVVVVKYDRDGEVVPASIQRVKEPPDLGRKPAGSP